MNCCTNNVAWLINHRQPMMIKFGGAIALDMGTPHEAAYQAF